MALISPREDLAGLVLDRHLSVRAAAETFGYNEQYLRRLLRTGRLEGIKIGQIWLISLASLEAHLWKGQEAQGRRYGPQGETVESVEYVLLVNYMCTKWNVSGRILLVYELNGPIRFIRESDREILQDAWLKWRTGMDSDTLTIKKMLSVGSTWSRIRCAVTARLETPLLTL